MAWVTPRTWVKGDLPTVTRLNTDLRDNMNFLSVVLGANVRNSTTITVPNNSQTMLAWDTEDYDSDTMHNPSGVYLGVHTPGKYIVGASSFWVAVAGVTNQRTIFLIRNRGGTDFTIAKAQERGVSATEQCGQYVETIDDGQAGDSYRVDALQDSGAPLNLTQSQSVFLYAQRICT
jgi:hypothetical protein